VNVRKVGGAFLKVRVEGGPGSSSATFLVLLPAGEEEEEAIARFFAVCVGGYACV